MIDLNKDPEKYRKSIESSAL